MVISLCSEILNFNALFSLKCREEQENLEKIHILSHLF